jgi:uncharacterized zinc-type alcohol dehydrogenase-like protein
VIQTVGYAASSSSSDLLPFAFERNAAGPFEVEIAVTHCGVCHSDIHQARNEWYNTLYPCVPGHEIVGRVTRTGSQVSRHAVGDTVGVGCMIESCGHCQPCTHGEQNYCSGPNSWLATYNGPVIPAVKARDRQNTYGRENTFGGYSSTLVVHEAFVLKIPAALAPELAAPILCAGVTTYAPLKHWGVKAGDQVGIVGFGGLGDMAAKIARAMGAEVTLFTSTPEKLRAAARMEAHAVLESDRATMQSLAGRFDFMLSTIPQAHDVNPFIDLLKRDATLVVVGALDRLPPVNNQALAFGRKSVAGSMIGNLAETQEVLDFCAKHAIGPQIEIIPMQQINEAFAKVVLGDVRFRFVIDMKSLAEPEPGR